MFACFVRRSRDRREHNCCVMLSISSTIVLSMAIGPTGVARSWETRGVYQNRPSMPPLEDIGEKVGVRPPWKAPRWAWSNAWRVGRAALPVLHKWDDCAPTDTNVNLWVCWLKAISGNSRTGYPDNGLAYDLLPPVTRRIVARPFASFYPLLHHQNVALRSAFLDQRVEAECQRAAADLADAEGEAQQTAVVVLGAGFDLRSLRLSSEAARACRWVEVDLPHVVEQRRRLLARLTRRRPELVARSEGLGSLAANLSMAEEVTATLRSALQPTKRASTSSSITRDGGTAIFVFEALLIYIEPEAAAGLLRACADEAAAAGFARATLCFADRLPGVKGFEYDEARSMLAQTGFALEEETWLPKPGLARHMGVARSGDHIGL